MNKRLNRNEEMESFSAVKSFLQSGGRKLSYIDLFVCAIKVNRPNFIKDNIEFEYNELDARFILHSDTFKAHKYFHSVSTSYHAFSWDEIAEELKFRLNGLDYIVKHIQ